MPDDDSTISDLPPNTVPSLDDLYVNVQGDTTKRISMNQMSEVFSFYLGKVVDATKFTPTPGEYSIAGGLACVWFRHP